MAASLAPPASTVSAAVIHGTALRFERLGSEPALPRVFPCEDTLLRVVDGAVRLTLPEDERILTVGDEAVIPAGQRHRLASAGAEARVVIGLRPLRR